MSQKKVKYSLAVALLASLTLQADPFKTFTWSNATLYENGQPILAGDLTTSVYCGVAAGGPYPVRLTPPSGVDATSAVWDLAPLVEFGGGPGTYYCIGRHMSNLYLSESGDSNEINFTVDAGQLGFVPLPPQNLQIVLP